jgi:hypothetical protein
MTTNIASSKIALPEAQWENRQPEKLDYLRPNGFRFVIQNLPKVTYFCQSANIPSITLGYAIQQTPLVDIPYPGEKITYGELNIRFMIQEDMANYIELYKWINDLGSPDNTTRFQQRFEEQSILKNPGRNPSARLSDGRPVVRNTDATDFSDASLLALDSNNNPIARLNFTDCFPTVLSGLDFDVSSGNTQYFTAQAQFKYKYFTAESLVPRT